MVYFVPKDNRFFHRPLRKTGEYVSRLGNGVILTPSARADGRIGFTTDMVHSTMNYKERPMIWIWLLQFGSCAAMTGAIWLVQLLIYPSFALVPVERFQSFQKHHTRQITWVVAPLMLVELVSGATLLYFEPNWVVELGFAGIIVLWLWTFFVSVPIHEDLEKRGYDLVVIKKLVWSNWPRTLIWSMRLMLLYGWFVMK
jgi:hypothetical protein